MVLAPSIERARLLVPDLHEDGGLSSVLLSQKSPILPDLGVFS